MTQAAQKRLAIQWAKKRLPQLERKMGIRRSAINQLIADAERKFNIGCARAIERALKIQRNPESEEEIEKWERGEVE